jgi:hypothetical protein
VKILTLLLDARERCVLFFKHLGDGGVFAIWTGALFLAGALIWGLSAAPRARLLAAQTNSVLAEIGEKRRVKEPLSSWGLPGAAAQAGTWFVTGENNLAVVWSLPVDGVFAPFLTLFTHENEIEKTVPLSATAALFAARDSGGYPDLWSSRINRAARQIRRGRDAR